MGEGLHPGEPGLAVGGVGDRIHGHDWPVRHAAAAGCASLPPHVLRCCPHPPRADIRSLKDEPGHDLPFLLTSSFSKGGGKVSDFQIKNSDGSVVDIVLKPLVSGVVTRKVRELTQREFGDEKRLKASEGCAPPAPPWVVATLTRPFLGRCRPPWLHVRRRRPFLRRRARSRS